MTIHDGLCWERVVPEPHQGSPTFAILFDFAELDRARTDVNADEVLAF
jgi:hypothetical protein